LGRGNFGGFDGLGGVPPGLRPGFFSKPPLLVCVPIFFPGMSGQYMRGRPNPLVYPTHAVTSAARLTMIPLTEEVLRHRTRNLVTQRRTDEINILRCARCGLRIDLNPQPQPFPRGWTTSGGKTDWTDLCRRCSYATAAQDAPPRYV
jgi:hypothetical protein